MSNLCGKFDLYDHISMLDPTPEVNGSIIIYDIYRGFDKFKKLTNGVIYQSIEKELTESNIERELETNPILKRKECNEIVPDARFVDGFKVKTKYNYIYMLKEYKSLAQINNFGYYAKRAIKFNDLIDLSPYLMYCPAVISHSNNSEYLEIALQSEWDHIRDIQIACGSEQDISIYQDNYKKLLIKLIADLK